MKNDQKMREWQNMFLAGMYVISMTVSIVLYGCFDGHLKQAYQIGLFACVLLVPLWIVLRNVKEELIEYERVFVPGLFVFGLTMVTVLVSVHINTCLLWIGGCILLTALFPTGIGVGFSLMFGCVFCFVARATVSYEIFMFLMGLVLCGSVYFLKQRKTAVIVVLVDLIVYTLLFFAMTRGGVAFFEQQSLISMAGFVLFLLAANHLYYMIYLREEVVFRRIVRGDFPLLVSIRQYSKPLCVHCVDVSELSVRAARETGCNEKLCRAGGLYHEAGRIYGKNSGNYIKNTVKLMETYHFPKKVKELILQLAPEYELPKTKEAVIVGITDQILSSIDYLEKKKKKKSSVMVEKLVEHVFEKKEEAGVLEDAGFSREDVEKLKKFYRENSF